MQNSYINSAVQITTVIVEPVGAGCNLACTYCYHSNIRTSKMRIMSRKVLERLIQEAMILNPKKIKFLWHGGEPLLAGLDFYRTAIELQKRWRVSEQQEIVNTIQTNATLINDEWTQFFKEHNFQISTSIDGPAWLHDICRKNQVGRGSYKETIRGIEILKKHGLKVGVVVTINRYNVHYPEIVYYSLLELGLTSFDLNIATDVPGMPSLAPHPQEAAAFLTRVFDIWFEMDDPSIYIRIFHNVIKALLGLPLGECSFSFNRCREYIACDEEGNLYTCGRFLKEPVVYIGSCVSDHILDLLSTPRVIALYDKVASIKEECKSCYWFKACGGGCAYQRWLNGGFGSHFPQCEIRKALFEHVKRRIEPYL